MKERSAVLFAFIVISIVIGGWMAASSNIESQSPQEISEQPVTAVNESAPPIPCPTPCTTLTQEDLLFIEITSELRERMEVHCTRITEATSTYTFYDVEIEADQFHRYLERVLEKLEPLEVSPEFVPLKNEEISAIMDAKRYEFFLLIAVRSAENQEFNEYYLNLDKAQFYADEANAHLYDLTCMYENVTGLQL